MAPPMTLVYNYSPPVPAVEASAAPAPAPPPAVEASAPATPPPPNVHHAPDDPSPEPMAVDTPPPVESPRDGDMEWEVTSVTHEIRERVADLSIEQPDDHMTDFPTFDSFQQPYGQQSYPPLSGYVQQQQAQASQLQSNQTLRRQHPHLFLQPSEVAKRQQVSPERSPERLPVPLQSERINHPVVGEPIVTQLGLRTAPRIGQPIATRLSRPTSTRIGQPFVTRLSPPTAPRFGQAARPGSNIGRSANTGVHRIDTLLHQSNVARRRRELNITSAERRRDLFAPAKTTTSTATGSAVSATTATGHTTSGTTASGSTEPARATTLTPIINGPRARKRRAEDTEHQLVVSFQESSPERRRRVRPMVSPRARREQNRNIFARLAYMMISNIVAAASGIGRSVSDRITRIFVRDNHGIDETRGIDRDGNSYVKRRRLHIEEPDWLAWVPAAQFEDRANHPTTVTTGIWHVFFTLSKLDPNLVNQIIAPLQAVLAAVPTASSLGQDQLSGTDIVLTFANHLVDVRDKLYSFNKFRRFVKNNPNGCNAGTLWFGLANGEKSIWKYVNDVLSSPDFAPTLLSMAEVAHVDVQARHLAHLKVEDLERLILDIEAVIEDMPPPSYIASDDYSRRLQQHFSSSSVLESVHTPSPVMPGTFTETAPSEQEPLPAENEPAPTEPEPELVGQEIAPAEHEHMPAEQETAPSDEQPAPANLEITSSDEDLMDVDRDITTSDQRPHPSEYETAATDEQLAPAEHEIAASGDQSASTATPTERVITPLVTQPASSEQLSASAEQEPTPAEHEIAPAAAVTPIRRLPPLPESFYSPGRVRSPRVSGNPGLTPPHRRLQERFRQSESLSLEVKRMTLNRSTVLRSSKTKRLRGYWWRHEELKIEAAYAEARRQWEEEELLRLAEAEAQHADEPSDEPIDEAAAEERRLELEEKRLFREFLRDTDSTHKKIAAQYITDFEPRTPMNTREKPILRSILKGRVNSPSTHSPRRGAVSPWLAKRQALDRKRPPPPKSVHFADGIFSPEGRPMDLIVRRSDLFDTLSQRSDDKDEEEDDDDEAQKAEEARLEAANAKIRAMLEAEEPLVGMRMSTEAAAKIRLHKEQLAKDAEEAAELAAAEARAAEEAAARAAEEEAQRQLQERLAKTHGLRLPEKPLVGLLPEEWTLRVEETLHAAATTTLATTSEGIDLRRHDFAKVVPETEWLNDEIVNGTLAWLDRAINSAAGIKEYRKHTRKCLAMSSFFWKQISERGVAKTERTLKRCGVHKDNILDVDTILLPICEHNHWTLIVIRPSKRTIAHMNSLNPGVSSKKTDLAVALVKHILEDKFVEEEWKVVVHEAPRQTNGWDCGVHTVTNGMCVALGLNAVDCYSAVDMPLQRLRIAATLLNQGFSGDFDLRVY